MTIHRREVLLAAGAAALSPVAVAQTGHEGHGPMYERLREPGRVDLPELHAQQRYVESPAPAAANQGRWVSRAPLPLPRTEMAWACEFQGRMHLVGGYGEQRVDRPYHHAYEPGRDRWRTHAALPRGANHVGVCGLGERLYAIGGMRQQNIDPDALCFAWEPRRDRWSAIAPLPRALGAVGIVALGGKLHVIGGADGATQAARRSTETHYVYDPAADRWETRAPLPTARDHIGIVVVDGRIHVLAGRVNSFLTNSQQHDSYDPQTDAWTQRNPVPSARSGLGTVYLNGKIFCVGGEGWQRVYGVNEAYDVAADRWESYAPMPTPRHGMGAVLIGETMYVAGGGPVMGGGYLSAVHEAFSLS